MSRVLRLTEHNFDQEICQGEIPALVEFSASWCLPSQQQKPLIQELAKEYSGQLNIGELNVDQNPQIAAEYKIMGCPTFITFNAGKTLQRRVGAQSKKQLLELIQSAINSD
jgi:thioredoxin 1